VQPSFRGGYAPRKLLIRFHLAAVASVEQSHQHWLESNRTNLVGTITVLEAARTRRIPVVYASSAAVYGDNPAVPLSETALPNPLSAYGADKLGSELHAAVATCVHGVPTTGFRFFNVYGPRQNPKSPYSGVISIFADHIRRGEPIVINGDGDQMRDFVYVDDVVQVLVTAMTLPEQRSSVYNICTGCGITINRLVATIAALTGRLPEVSYGPARPGDVRRSIGSPARLIHTFGKCCATHLDRGLAVTLEWLDRHQRASL
ncbi:MAG: NAD-dependent epimerase/dehydratase family protein, partial [Rhodospirillaceae bacterium]